MVRGNTWCAIAVVAMVVRGLAAETNDYRLIEIRGDGLVIEHEPGAPVPAAPVPGIDAADVVGRCGVAANVGAEPPVLGADRRPDAVHAAPDLLCAELACDADVEFFERLGSVQAVEQRIRALVEAVNEQFERDAGIRHVITTIIVRTSEPDPYGSYSGVGLTNDFRDHWLEHHRDVARDAAMLFTDRVLAQGIVGWAWSIGSICTDESFCVARPEYTATLARSTDLVAHELGHLWGAPHCVCGAPPYTMNPIITGANLFHPDMTIPAVLEHRRTRSCLARCDRACPEDCAEPVDGVVDVIDLLRALADRGAAGPCAGIDIAALLEAWGACH